MPPPAATPAPPPIPRRRVNIPLGAGRPLPLRLSIDRREDIQQPDDPSHDTVRDDSPLARRERPALTRPLQAQPTIDDADGDDGAPEPDVAVGPDDAAAVLLEHDVVQEAEEGLEEEQDEEDDADDGVGVVQGAGVGGGLRDHVDADGKGGDVEEVGEELEEAVHPPEAWEGGEADEDAADGEEEGEGEGGEDGVGDDHGLVAVRDELAEVEGAVAIAVGGKGIAVAVATAAAVAAAGVEGVPARAIAAGVPAELGVCGGG